MSENRDVTGSISFGLIFIAIGVLALLQELGVVTLAWQYVLPVILIVAGIAVIVSSQLNARRSGAR